MLFWDYIMSRKTEIASHGRSLNLLRVGRYVVVIVTEPEKVNYPYKVLDFKSDDET